MISKSEERDMYDGFREGMHRRSSIQERVDARNHAVKTLAGGRVPLEKWEGNRKPSSVSNPKDLVGVKKVSMSTVPCTVMMELSVAMLEGALKYGRHNYRVSGVAASIYYDACKRHLDAWNEGQDIDPGSGLNHIIKAISTLTVLRDAMINENWIDDRPPRTKNQEWMENLNKICEGLLEKYPEDVRRAPFTEKPL